MVREIFFPFVGVPDVRIIALGNVFSWRRAARVKFAISEEYVQTEHLFFRISALMTKNEPVSDGPSEWHSIVPKNALGSGWFFVPFFAGGSKWCVKIFVHLLESPTYALLHEETWFRGDVARGRNLRFPSGMCKADTFFFAFLH